jgi:hypothetical protein
VFPKSAVDYLGQAEFRHNANQQGDVIYSLMVKLQFTVHPPTIAQNSTFGRVSYTKDEFNRRLSFSFCCCATFTGN